MRIFDNMRVEKLQSLKTLVHVTLLYDCTMECSSYEDS